MRLDLAVFRRANVARSEEAFKHKLDAWSPTDYGCALAGEVGELCNLLKKRMRDGEAAVDPQAIADEAADVLIYLDLLCARLSIDLAAATMHKFDEVSAKKGSAIRLLDPETQARFGNHNVAAALKNLAEW